MLTEVPGVAVGHWTDAEARTGCTVVLLPDGTMGSGEVRGGAPATREFALLDPMMTVSRVDAVVLSGGSAFGLAACDGVVRWCEETGAGYTTAAGPVPIVVGMSLYDLAVGDASVRPGADEGYAACRTAGEGAIEVGAVGAGAGATFAKWRGREHARPGGLGCATERDGRLVVAALVAVNSVGDIVEPGSDEARPSGRFRSVEDAFGHEDPEPVPSNTTLAVVVTNAVLDKVACRLVAEGAHDGFARALLPSHTRADGDAVVAAATGDIEADSDLVRWLAVLATERAIRSVA